MSAQKENDQEVYWNEEGGERWVAYIEQVEQMLSGLSARLFDGIVPRTGEHVLDVGCGGGITSAALAEGVGAGGSVMGVDISEVILNVARKRYGAVANLKFERADAGSFAFEPASFDLVTSRFGVMFFHDPDAAFANIRKATKPDGRMVFLCWRGLHENPWMALPAAAAFTVVPPPEKPDPEAPGPFSFAKPERVQRILQSAGFGDVELEPVDEPLNIGTVDQAIDWLTRMGAAAAPLQEASEADRASAIAAMRDALAEHTTADGVILPSGTWIVRAQAG